MRNLIASLVILMSVSANANIVRLDAGELAPGTDVSHVIEGVTILSYYHEGFTSRSYAPVIAPVIVNSCSAADNCSDQVFARSDASPVSANWGLINEAFSCERGSTFACFDSFSHVMNVSFDAATDYFSFEAHWLSDQPALFAFDGVGNLLFSCYALSQGDCFEDRTAAAGSNLSVLGFSRTDADVARVMIGAAGGMTRIKEITVSVPEPSTLALFGVALLAAVLFRRGRGHEVRVRTARRR